MSDFTKIEKKWQEYHEKNDTFKAHTGDKKEKYFYLVEFPYPSGEGLHVGHTRGYTALDVMARKKRMEGFNVLFPMGWDAFGEAAEGFAIKHKIHPKEAVAQNIATFKGQCIKMGLSFDWSREFSTTDPEYVKWTQWQFLQFFKKGLAYKAPAKVNWCPACKITKSNEEAAGGVCDRCNTSVEEKEKEQWTLRMKDAAQSLLDGLKDTNFQDQVKQAQINWIGKSEGAVIWFALKQNTAEKIEIFTTRPDTVFGASSIQIALDHPLIRNNPDKIKNLAEIENYIKATEDKATAELAQKTSALKGADKKERKQIRLESFKQEKEKTGVKIHGLTAINPVNGKELPVFISNYVLSDKGTGAVMSVPAHDQRDYEFAKKYGTEVIQVIEGDISASAFTGDGIHVNSDIINGLNNADAFKKIVAVLTKNGWGKAKTDYKLTDWVFSRQRFWGEPVPLIKCSKHGWVAVPDKDLPVTLPDVVNYQPTDTGESPLAKITDWVNTVCPVCGIPAVRETDTMPGWAGSSWYWLRFMDPKNDKEFAGFDAMKYWGQVDFYDGGMEHSARHLLYARFWNHFLFDEGLVPYREPVNVRVAHGMVLGEGGVKMSKSLGNVVAPDSLVDEYGADALRTYIMFMGDFGDNVNWQDEGVKGCRRYLDRVIRLGDKVNDNASADASKTGYSDKLESALHKAIKKVTDDINATKFNTAISAMHELTNILEKQDSLNKADFRTLLLLLHPFAPHITEELNEKLKLGKGLAQSKWPKYDPQKAEDSQIEIAVQINGKVKALIMISIDENQDSVKAKALAAPPVASLLDGQKILKLIIIPNRIVNIVV